MKKLLIALIGIPLIFISCKKNDHNPPQQSKMFTVTIENVSAPKMFLGSGVINTPTGDVKPGPLTPGKKYEFMVKAGKGQNLSFAVMLAATNDLFFGPNDKGIALYNKNGEPITADVTDQVHLYDAGTEINEEPVLGPNTVTNQSAPNTGPAEHGVVQEISKVTTDHFNYPSVGSVIKVWVKHLSGYDFMVTIINVSPMDALKTSKGNFPAPVSPGVWTISMNNGALYTLGQSDRGHGLEAIAEDGNPTNLGGYASANTGIVYPLSPGVWTVSSPGTMPLFKMGAFDYGKGLEAIAEDGNPASQGMTLKATTGIVSSGVFNTPEGASQPAPLGPGMKYTFSFSATHMDDRLSFATMFVQSNDLIYAPEDEGIRLFNKYTPISGDITSSLSLWDTGTEVNEDPGYGPNQVMRQSAPNTGVTEHNPVGKVKDSFTYPSVQSVIKVTISSN
ncbi:MAG: spondin domain-containing protein [Ginsengibacter sp.]